MFFIVEYKRFTSEEIMTCSFDKVDKPFSVVRFKSDDETGCCFVGPDDSFCCVFEVGEAEKMDEVKLSSV